MQFNLANSYDTKFLLADTQTIADETAVGGKDSAGNLIYLDLGLSRYDGDVFNVFMRYTAADFTTGDEVYTFAVQSSPDATFGTAANIITHFLTPTIGVTATVTATGTIYGPFALGLTHRYVRCFFDSSGSNTNLVIDKVWLAPRKG